LHTLEAFVIAARTQSFKQAAAELHLTPSAVSHQIKALETHLGFALFRRLNRELRLSAAGREYLHVVEDSLSRLREQGERLHNRHRRPRLRISLGPFIANEILLPALPEFRRLHPQIDLVIETDLRPKDLMREDIDIALRFGNGDWPEVRAVRLLTVTAAPVCAPRIAPRRATAKTLAAMTRLESSPMPQGWSQWSRLAKVTLPAAGDAIWFDSYLALLQAAEKGLGVALGMHPVIDHWLAAGRLVAPWGYRVGIPYSYYLLHRPQDASRPEVLQFLAWARTVLGRSTALVD
jgi:LysR family glycine cleavage system transcriptional activator